MDVATTEQQYGIATQIPIGDTGFTIGANYGMQRFTGDLIPNQVLKVFLLMKIDLMLELILQNHFKKVVRLIQTEERL